jgi:hypothetical protein
LDRAFAQLLAEEIRNTSRGRLQRTEAHIASLNAFDREALAAFLVNMADRPPLSNKGWESIRGAMLGLGFDLLDQSADEVGIPDDNMAEMFRTHLEAGEA